MLIREYLKTLTCRRKSNARRRLPRPNEISEQLESRTLLTGNVQVSLSGANAELTGDASNNEIEVVVDNGSVVVRGLNGTTINQATTPFTLVSGATTLQGRLTASLGGGDDIATIRPGITFAGNVSLSGDGGADTLQALTGTYRGSLTLRGNAGATSIVVDGATVSGDLDVRGQGLTLASISNSTIHGRLDVLTSDGADSVVIQNTTVDGVAGIHTDGGEDNIVLQNSTLHGRLWIEAGSGNDVVYVNSSTVARAALIGLRRGNDTLQVLGGSSFGRRLFIAGGRGHDAANIAADTTTRRVVRGSINSSQVDAALISSRITDSTTGAIARANTLRTTAVPTLTLVTSVATVSENGGATAATLTVTRTGSTTAALEVTLTSSNTSKATVPATVMIPAGSTSVTASISAVDNTAADSDAVVTITATAAGLVSGTTTLTVTNNDVASLTVTANQTTVTEGAGASAVTYTVARNSTDITQPLTVTLLSSTPTRLTVAGTVTIPANAASVTFPGAAIENTVVDGSAAVVVTASSAGFANGSASVTVTDNEPATLTVVATPTTVAENAASGSVTYTVSRNTPDNTLPLTVNLVSDTPGRLTVAGSTIVIPANASSVTFVGSPVDNLNADGNKSVVVTASATGFANGTASVTVNDNDSALTLTALPTTVAENAATGSVTYTVVRNSVDITQPLTVNLVSGTPGRLTVANSTVTIPANATSVSFVGSPVDNTVADGNATVTVTASVSGFTDGTASVTVTDNDSVLTLAANPGTVAENAASGAVTYTVSRNSTNTTQPLTVTVVSGTPTRLTVASASVTIPANAVSVTFLGSPVDNTTADGNASVIVTTSAPGFTNGTATVSVTDNEVATLTLTANQTTVPESAGATAVTYTVSRNTADLTQALTVNLVSETPGRLTVGNTVTIPANAASVTFPGAAVENTAEDGSAVVVVTASANGFVNGTRSVTVTDNDAGTLTVTPNVTSVAEDATAGTLVYTVTRVAANVTLPLTVNLVSSLPGRLTVAGTVTIPANATTATFAGTPVNNTIVDGNVPVVVTATADGFVSGTASVTVNNTDVPALTVVANPGTVAENAAAGSVTYTLTRNTTENSLPLTVTLASGLSGRLTVPGTATIPANAATVTFVGSPVDNTTADGNASVIVTTSAAGFTSGTATVAVTDNEVATLTLTANQTTIPESAGATAVTYTVSRNTADLTQALTINLVSGTPGRLTVGNTVTIPANAASVTFPGAAVENTAEDGSAVVVVTASANGFVNGTRSVTVTDNDAGTLTVTPNVTSVAEDATAGTLVYTVTRSSANVTQSLTVNLISGQPGRLTVAGTVTIAANATSATFEGTPVNNTIVDGDAPVIVTASATGFASGTASVTVNDNDSPALTVSPGTSAILENAVAGTIFYTVARNTADTSQALAVNLASNNTGRLVTPATVTIPVGRTSATFEVTPVNNALTDGNVDAGLTASALGFAGGLWTVTVIDDEPAGQEPVLTVAMSPFSLAENSVSGSTLTVTRPSGNTAQALLVGLTYSSTTRLSGPASITIAAGQTSGTATLLPIDNLAVDGNADVDISASATGFATGQEFLTVIDNENTVLSLTTAATTVSETSGTLAGTVSTSFVSTAPIVVSLSYQNTSVLTGPANVIIPAGAASAPVTFTIVNGSVQDASIVTRISATALSATTGVRDVTVTDTDTMALTAVFTAADAVQSNGTKITRNATSQITGTTAAGALVTVDSDGDGVFDNGSATAGNDGSYTVDVTLSHTTANHGENRLVVKSVSGANSADTAVRAHLAVGTVVHFATSLGSYDVELLNTEAPLTVANFLSYVNSGAYQNMFVHRANSGGAKFIQGGGFKVSNGQVSSVVTTPAVANEFMAANSNVSGTLAMALLGDGGGGTQPNSGTSQWFVNTSDNGAGFDSGHYTVFGRVIGDGVAVARQISDLTQQNLNTLYSSSALAGVPILAFNPANTPITGTAAITSNSAVVTGTNTNFTTELTVGQSIVLGSGRAYFVASIQSDTSLTLTTTAPFTAANLAITKNVVPNDADFVVFSNIGKILDTI